MISKRQKNYGCRILTGQCNTISKELNKKIVQASVIHIVKTGQVYIVQMNYINRKLAMEKKAYVRR